jgi:serine phosphatase RsbU (regulator of sigma subunit)
VWIIVGDVAGHGLRAGIVMSRIRSTIRAYALESRTPDEVLARTDAKLQHFEPDELATVLCAALAPPFDEAIISSAGHPAPVLAHLDADAELVPIVPDRPIGIGGGEPRSAITAQLRPGSVLVAYTDGLIERRGEVIDVGLERLRSVVTAGDPEVVCRDVMGALVGTTVPTDDIAVLTSRRSE